MQEEVGNLEGTPHLQFKIALKKKGRPMEHFETTKIHWEKSGVWKGFEYCLKADTHTGKRWYRGCVPPLELHVDEPYGWQKEVLEILERPIDNRKVFWFWSEKGNIGKSALVRFLVIKHKAFLVGNKAADMKSALATVAKEKKIEMPTLIMMDVPRTCSDYVSYQGIEEIKNGIFFSPKFESGMVCMNSPHFIVFANVEPKYEQLSADRWVVKHIEA